MDRSTFFPSACEKIAIERASVRQAVWSRPKFEQSRLDNNIRGRLTPAHDYYRGGIEAPRPRVHLYPTETRGYRIGSGRVHY